LKLFKTILGITSITVTCSAFAGPIYQPPGANLTLGDVAHGRRIQSASGNPAAAASDLARSESQQVRGTVLSAAAGIEYGNLDNLFGYYDNVTGAYEPSDPEAGGDPVNLPTDKIGGIYLGVIWDNLDPDIADAVSVLANEIATQAVLLAAIKDEGHAKAWVAVDAPFVIGNEYLGGTWTFGVNWSGSSKAYGLTQAIQFDPDEARRRLEDWFSTLPIDRPEQLPVSDDVLLKVDPITTGVLLSIDNDSSIITKATQTTEFDLGYSRQAWSSDAGSLFLGAEARLYVKRLSRLSVRFGDITDSEELFDAIRDSNFRQDEGLGVDVGALWVGNNYQLGAQVTNINEPSFLYPDVNLDTYRSEVGRPRYLLTIDAGPHTLVTTQIRRQTRWETGFSG
jgi:hypothetical protein